MSAAKPLTAYQRALIRACRARLVLIPLREIAIPHGVSRQRVHQICAGIVPGAGDDLQDDKLRAAHEKDIGHKVSDAQWQKLCRHIDADLTKFLIGLKAEAEAGLARLRESLNVVA